MARSLYSLGFIGLSGLSVRAQQTVYGQCGGTGWSGATTCASGSVCTVLNSYYSQCLPSTPSSFSSIYSSALPTTVASTTSFTSTPTSALPPTTTVSSASATPSGTCAPNSPPSSAGKLRFAGVNISGFDFGCNSDGNCNWTGAWPPLAEYYGHDGVGQMTHFVNDDGYNVFRLPVGWQYLTQSDTTAVATLNAANLAEYDALVNACLATGAYCIVDVHNYARFDGAIIGQGGPSNALFAQLWSNIAAHYAGESKIIFGVMNEPYDVPDINLWAASVQAAVTAIRQAGATTQIILLPGNNWTSAETLVSNGSADALNKVVNPDGSITNLVFDVHKYLDSDNSGTHTDCVMNNIDNAWAPLAQWLRCHGRQAFNTETGGGNVADCVTYMSQQIAFQAANSDVFLGYVGWAAGNFDPSYVLGETPTETGSTWSDTLLVSGAMSPKVNGLVA
ncbi:carbohydrate-binding module family 1 protein/Glycoside hydrolase family 5 protein [Artomyces pyxidatus]|uniref:Carbohydrate-binding module family 1 protein/Glycoside hydrolase family 5 protein n=1 Tax=Artomyces pyxidatus TaxID=48021 RepID=A0ACB8SPL2_9AGAM|nr:carbohydrate-binding module family 1 protein/Glycoside hydrolase family 5 protein [Artomyces pyxidatus]